MRTIIRFPTKKKSLKGWVNEINDAFWDLIFMLVQSPEDVQGAKLASAFLNYFFPYKITADDVLRFLYPLRGWEQDLGIPLPYILHTIYYYRKVGSARTEPTDVLIKSKLLFYRNNPTLLRTKEREGEQDDEREKIKVAANS